MMMMAALHAGAQHRVHVLHEPTQQPDRYQLLTRPKPVIFFYNADSSAIGGLRKAGDTVLPCRYRNIMGYEVGRPFRDNILYLLDTDAHRYQRAGFEVKPGYKVKPSALARDGRLLYEPFWYDNGPDYWVEGRQRFVYDNKLGFVNRFGEVTVEAQYPFVSPYNNGMAYACLDCIWKVRDSNDEHGSGFEGTAWIAIDKRGKKIKEWPSNAQPSFTMYDSLPKLKPDEARLAARLLKLPEAAEFARAYIGNSLKEVRVVCYDRPFLHSPYFHLSFRKEGEDPFTGVEYQFLVSPDGRTILHLDQWLQKAQTLPVWRKEQLDNFEE